MKRIRIFTSTQERVVLYLPLFFLFFVPIELIFWGSLTSKLANREITFLLNSVFLNVSHIYLTFLMLIRLPEFKSWIDSKYDGNSFVFWTKSFFVLMFIGMVSFLIPTMQQNVYFAFFLVFFNTWGLQHGIFQTRGLSHCYNVKLKELCRSENQKIAFLKSEKLEKLAFNLLYFSILLFNLIGYFNGIQLFNDLVVTVMKYISTLGVAAYVCLLVAAVKTLPYANKSNKGLFLTRTIAYPLGLFSFFATFASVTSHAVDYFCVFEKMNRNSAQAPSFKKSNFRLGLICLFTIGSLFALTLYMPHLWISPALGQCWFIFGFLHFYLDGVIFAMRHPAGRKFIAPLLNTA